MLIGANAKSNWLDDKVISLALGTFLLQYHTKFNNFLLLNFAHYRNRKGTQSYFTLQTSTFSSSFTFQTILNHLYELS